MSPFIGFLLAASSVVSISPAAEPTVGQKIIQTSIAYGIDPVAMVQLSKCESGLNPKAWNKKDPYGGAKGIYQYLTPTFYREAKGAGIENPDIWNIDQQIELTAYLISNGKKSLWTCARNMTLDTLW